MSEYTIVNLREDCVAVISQLPTPFERSDFIKGFKAHHKRSFPTLRQINFKSIDLFIKSIKGVADSVLPGEFFYVREGITAAEVEEIRRRLMRDMENRLENIQLECLKLAREFARPFSYTEFVAASRNRNIPTDAQLRKFGFNSLSAFLSAMPQLERMADGRFTLGDMLPDAMQISPARLRSAEDQRSPVVSNIDALLASIPSDQSVRRRGSNLDPPPPSALTNPFTNGPFKFNTRPPSPAVGEQQQQPEQQSPANIVLPRERPQSTESGQSGGGGSPNVSISVKREIPDNDEPEIICLDDQDAHPQAKRSRLGGNQGNDNNPPNPPDVKPFVHPATPAPNRNNNAGSSVEITTPNINGAVLPDSVRMANNTVPFSPAPFFSPMMGNYMPQQQQQKADTPSSKHEAFGKFIAHNLDEAEKKGLDSNALSARIIAALNGNN